MPSSACLAVVMDYLSFNYTLLLRILVQLICFIVFAIQVKNVLENYLMTTITSTHVKEMDLKDIGFPLVVKICVKPGFNETAVMEAGYKNLWSFWNGQSKYNRNSFMIYIFSSKQIIKFLGLNMAGLVTLIALGFRVVRRRC